MGLEKRTIKIIVIVVVVILILGGIAGLVLGLLLSQRYVQLEVWPRSEEYKWTEPLIQFRQNDPGSYHHWIHRINDFLTPYENSIPERPPRAPCSVRPRQSAMRSPACSEAMQVWDQCNVDNFYGYPEGRPCVFLRLANIHYWVPQPFNMSIPNLPLPIEMPDHLKMTMREIPAHEYGDFVWVSCEGELPSDKENIGPIRYVPMGQPPGFPLSRLHTYDRIPYAARGLPDKDPGPLVAVQFENPRRGVLINVACRAWSRDLYYDTSYRMGRARFEIFVE